VDPEIVDALSRKFPDFRRAYSEDGLSLAEFDTFGPTIRTMRQFLEATHELAVKVRDLLLPNPDSAAS
jgi:transaldolase